MADIDSSAFPFLGNCALGRSDSAPNALYYAVRVRVWRTRGSGVGLIVDIACMALICAGLIVRTERNNRRLANTFRTPA
jgi:hypothetical protein